MRSDRARRGIRVNGLLLLLCGSFSAACWQNALDAGPADLKAVSDAGAGSSGQLAESDHLPREAEESAAKGDVAQAIAKMESALQTRQAVSPESDPGIARLNNALGHLYNRHKDYAQAITLLQKALPVLEKAEAAAPDELCLCEFRLSKAYSKTGERELAARFSAKAVAIAQRLHDAVNPTLRNGDFPQAETLLRECLRVDLEAIGPAAVNTGIVLYKLADALTEQNKTVEAMVFAEKSLKLFEGLQPPRPKLLADAWHSKFKIYSMGNNYAEAEECLRQQKRAIARGPEPMELELAAVDSDLAAIYANKGSVRDGEGVLSEALPVLRRGLGATDPFLLQSIENMRSIEAFLGKPREAAELLQEIERNVASLPPRDPTRRLCLFHVGHAYIDSGDFEKAKGVFEGLKRGYELGELPTVYFQQGLSEVYVDTGDYAKAKQILQETLDAVDRRSGLAWEKTLLKRNLADLFSATGDYPRAEQLCQEVLKWDEQSAGIDRSDVAIALHGLARAQMGLGQFRDAERNCLRAGEILRKLDSPLEVGVRLTLSELYFQSGEYGKSLQVARDAVSAGRSRLPEGSIVTLRARADYVVSLIALGQYDEAESEAKQVLASQRRLLGACSVFQSERQQLAMQSLARLDLDNYLSVAGPRQLAPEEVYQYVLDWKGSVTRRQAQLRQVRAVRAAGNETAMKSLAELQDVSLRLEFLHNAAPEPDAARRAERSAEAAKLTARSEELGVYLGGLGQSPTTEPQEAVSSSPAVATSIASLKTSLSKAGPGTALVDFLEYSRLGRSRDDQRLRIERRLSAFVVRADEPVEWIDLGPSQPVAVLVDEWRDVVARGLLPVNAGLKLRQVVWEKLPAGLKGVKTLLYSPDGPLCRLPLAALPGGTPGSYLAQELAMVVVPVPADLPQIVTRPAMSAQPLVSNVEQPAPGSAPPESARPAPERVTGEPRLLLVGDVDYDRSAADGARPDLPSLDRSARRMAQSAYFPRITGAARAMESIRKEFLKAYPRATIDALQGSLATKGAYVSSAPAYDWQVLITHGFFAPPPLRRSAGIFSPEADRSGVNDASATECAPGLLCGLAFAGANREPASAREDGVLTALTVSDLDVSRTDLVVLAACESGMGVTSEGEGVLGLQRAYQLAGARSVLASQWQVSERATLVFLEQFHHNLWDEKMTKLQALTRAQQWMLDHYDPADDQLLLGPVAVAGQAIDPKIARPRKAGDQLPPFFWAAFTLSGDWR